MQDSDTNKLFGSLWTNYRDAVLNYCLSRLKEPEAAADCVQKTFQSLWEQLKKQQTIQNYKAWLFVTAGNEIRHMFHENARIHAVPLEECSEIQIVGTELSIDDRCISADEINAYRTRILAELTPEERRLLHMRCVLKWSYAQIAAKEDCSEQAMRQRFVRLRYKVEKKCAKIWS